MVFLIEKYNDINKIQTEQINRYERGLESYDLIMSDNDMSYYKRKNKLEESADNLEEIKISVKNESDEEAEYVFFIKQQQQQLFQLIPYKRRKSVSFTSISASSTSISSTSSSFSVPFDYGIKVNVNELDMNDEDRLSLTTLDTSSPNYQMKINFITKEKLESIQNELINQINADIDLKHQLLNKNITNYVSDVGDLKLNERFLIYLLNKLNLIDLLLMNESRNTIDNGFYLNETLYWIKRNDFMKKLNKLLTCLNKMERQLYDNFTTIISSSLAGSQQIFDANFFLNLSFLVFEQAENLTSRNFFNQKSSSTDLITNETSHLFEMDEIHCQQENVINEKLFEENLNIIILNFILKYLPDLIKLPCSSGKLIIQFFVTLFDIDFSIKVPSIENINDLNHDIIDIDNFMSKPICTNEKIDFITSNPITQSFQTFLNNLNALNYQTQDPFLEAKQNDDNFNYGRNGCNQYNMSARFAFCYYTMGCFDVEKNLFDNAYQSLYDTKAFNTEFEELFQFDTFTSSKNIKNQTNFKQSASNWPNIPSATNNNDENIDLNEKNLLDEIMDRISTINTSNLFDSYFKIITDSYTKDPFKTIKPIKDNNCSCCSSVNNTPIINNSIATRNWTVAPKLLPTNTISNCKSRTIQSVPILCNSSFEDSSIVYKSQADMINNWNRKADLRPIGTKPVSMFTTSNSTNRFANNKYQKYVNNSSLLTNTKKPASPNMFNEKIIDEKNIWNLENEPDFSNKYISPFTSYHYTNSGSGLDEYVVSCENIKQNESKLQKKIINFNNSKQIINKTSKASNSNNSTGKYSVAPMNYNKRLSSEYMNSDIRQSYNKNDININHIRSVTSITRSSQINQTVNGPPLISNFTLYNRQPRLSEPNIQFSIKDEIMTNNNKPTKTVYSISKFDSCNMNQSNKFNNNKQKVYDNDYDKPNRYGSCCDEKNERHSNQLSNGIDYIYDRFGKLNNNMNTKKHNGNNYRNKNNNFGNNQRI